MIKKDQRMGKRPQYLCLDAEGKKNTLEDINHCNLSEAHKGMAKECLLFTEDLERRLKDPKASLKEIRRLFELRAAALKKMCLTL